MTYDPNGNIKTYVRNGNGVSTTAAQMDNLTYTYAVNSDPTKSPNQLTSISDAVTGNSQTTDLKGNTSYSYDRIGNLINDGTNTTSWTVYGKIASVTNSGTAINYTYDAAGNRIAKTVTPVGGSATTTLYVRDAQGNVLSIYTIPPSGSPQQSEVDLYGSSRLGTLGALTVPTATVDMGSGLRGYVSTFTRGERSYELTNHLGNVLATVTDKKIAVNSTTNSSLIDHYTADVVTAQDYYPFGMLMPGRTFTAAGASNYRYGFNGKENDDEVKGTGNQIDYGMRVYDPRAGRFLSVDPLTGKYPFYSQYQFAGNKPIWATDLDGLEENTTSTYVYHPPVTLLIDHVRVQNQVPQATLSSKPLQGKYQEQVQQEYTIQRFRDAGYNDDGSKPAWMRLAENKTFKNFADNIAFPLLEGYSYADGAGELKLLLKGGTEKLASFLGKKEFDALARTGTVNAKTIRFSQDNIAAEFKDGKDFQTLLDQLKSGQNVKIEPIRIVEKDNMVFSLDNRRLYIYQQAGVDIPYIKLDEIPANELDKFSTINNGISIEVRKPKPKPPHP